MSLKLARGDTYRIPFEGRPRDYSFAKKLAGGSLIFIDSISGKPVPFDERKLAKMVKERVAVQVLSSNWLERIDIHALMDDTAPNTPLEVRKKIEAAQAKVAEAAMLLFYVHRVDAAVETVSDLAAFIELRYKAALASGHFHKPSASALYRALKKGAPGERNLADLISKRGKHNKRQWKDPWVVKKLDEAVEHYYSEGTPQPPQLQEVVVTFLGQAIEEDRRRQARKEDPLKYPKRTAVENYIRGQETFERLTRRDPIKALKLYNGKSEGASAEFPLQHVQVDQTQIDEWINIYDEDGNVEDRKRPYLVSIIDVYSRMLLAAILTFDKPSTYTVQLAIKQMLRPKDFLVERWGYKKGSTDGSGQPKTITFDNGVENVGFSMRTLLGDSGIDMDVAPLATPQAKAIVERAFQTYNQGVWHSAPGGIPYKPHVMSARRLNSQEKAQWALDFATGVMWHWIVNVYHLNRNRTLEAIPARLWSEKVNDPMVGRAVSKRLDLVDVICGTRVRLKIDGAGVRYNGHLFNHQKVTHDFLLATLPVEKRSRRGRGKVDIEAIIYPHDCSHITIVDHVRNRFVRLPNSKPRFAEGLSYAEAALIREGDRSLDRQFVSEEDLILAKYNYFKLIDNARAQARAERAIRQAKKAKKKAVEEELVIWTLVDGDHVELGIIEPSVRGDAPYDVPQEMAILERKGSSRSHKDQARGVTKGRETREINKQLKELKHRAEDPTLAAPAQREALPVSASIPVVENPSGFLDALADDLD
ncbi:putative transposase [Rhizobium leguminosarum]